MLEKHQAAQSRHSSLQNCGAGHHVHDITATPHRVTPARVVAEGAVAGRVLGLQELNRGAVKELPLTQKACFSREHSWNITANLILPIDHPTTPSRNFQWFLIVLRTKIMSLSRPEVPPSSVLTGLALSLTHKDAVQLLTTVNLPEAPLTHLLCLSTAPAYYVSL